MPTLYVSVLPTRVYPAGVADTNVLLGSRTSVKTTWVAGLVPEFVIV